MNKELDIFSWKKQNDPKKMFEKPLLHKSEGFSNTKMEFILPTLAAKPDTNSDVRLSSVY